VTGIATDSRALNPGDCFVAVAGHAADGHAFIEDAVRKGAAALVVERAVEAQVPVVVVPNSSLAASLMAKRFYGDPASRLRLAGITGTNGKTSSAFLLRSIMNIAHGPCGLIGTIGYGVADELSSTRNTTPGAVDLYRVMADFLKRGCRSAVMEVSSHAAEQGRIEGLEFDVGGFTNVTRDHLDYHGTLEAYGAAKARLFRTSGLRAAVVNVRDGFGRELADTLDPSIERVLFSTSNEIWAPAGSGWIRVPELRTTTAGLTLHVESSWGAGTLRSPLVGEFNAENLLAVLGVLLGWRVPLQQALVALATCVAPPGRMQAFGGGAQPLALVDYAHSPDALAKVLDAARAHARGRLICVFGCGGDRDPGKRPLMGALAESRADLVVVTDDNPRTEDSRAIIEQILAGMQQPEAAHVVSDRAEAIHFALAEADAGDVVVVAGKGHEDYQIVGREVRPFSDRAVVLDALGEEA